MDFMSLEDAHRKLCAAIAYTKSLDRRLAMVKNWTEVPEELAVAIDRLVDTATETDEMLHIVCAKGTPR